MIAKALRLKDTPNDMIMISNLNCKCSRLNSLDIDFNEWLVSMSCLTDSQRGEDALQDSALLAALQSGGLRTPSVTKTSLLGNVRYVPNEHLINRRTSPELRKIFASRLKKQSGGTTRKLWSTSIRLS